VRELIKQFLLPLPHQQMEFPPLIPLFKSHHSTHWVQNGHVAKIILKSHGHVQGLRWRA